ncbi:MAG: lysozyme inhibitor LprI family protein [Gemmatimonadaceae bacterium]
MKNFSIYVIAVLAASIVASGCSQSKKKTPTVASVPQDTMLLRDLAEANRNTANAAAADNSLNTVRTTENETLGSTPTTQPQTLTPQTRVVDRPSTASSEVLTSSSVVVQPGSPAVVTPRTVARPTAPRRAPRSQSASAASSGDPCDSRAPVDQRTCLNRSIVANDADLNRTYQELIEQSRKSGGSELEERFRQSQRDWINTRDAECLQRAGAQTALWARARGQCLAEYSAKRTAELQRSLNSLRGQ